jgi:hypothetical protein
MADISVAMAQYARRVEDQKMFLRGTAAAHDGSNLSMSSKVEVTPNESQQSDEEKSSDDEISSDEEEEPESDDGIKERKEKAPERSRSNRVIVKLASFKAIPELKSSETGAVTNEWDLSLIRRQLKDITKRIRHNLEALSDAEPVKTAMATPREGNERVFRVLNKTVQINNFLVDNEGNKRMVPILADFLKFARIILGGDIPIEETDVDPNTPQALSNVMDLLDEAYKELEEVRQPAAWEDELLKFKKRKGVVFAKVGFRASSGGSSEERLDEGQPVRKKMKPSGRSTEDATKNVSKTEAKKGESDDDEPTWIKTDLSGVTGTAKKASKTKGKK